MWVKYFDYLHCYSHVPYLIVVPHLEQKPIATQLEGIDWTEHKKMILKKINSTKVWSILKINFTLTEQEEITNEVHSYLMLIVNQRILIF